MGTHPSGPSRIANGNLAGTELLAFIRDYPQALGDAAARFGADLPFLLKVLSVNTALSIQSHPNKELAEKLHREKPKVPNISLLQTPQLLSSYNIQNKESASHCPQL